MRKGNKMRIRKEGNNLIITEIQDFDIGQTLECGQCFHFKKIAENEYGISAFDKLLHIKQEFEVDELNNIQKNNGKVIFYDTTIEDYENIWKEYFDFDRNYNEIKQILLAKDDKLKESMETMWGVRILNQDFFETLISFIISQNKQIPHIKQIVENFSRKYGKYLGKIGCEEFYSFPDVNTLKEVTVDELRELKVGFRAPYIYDAIQKVASGELHSKGFAELDSEQSMVELMKVKGIGEKVANCVMLFSLGKRDAFPVDVWIKRIMEHMYFHEETNKEIIRKKAVEMFGEYGGYAQQYLFYYGKMNNLGK